ncbi:MAG: hypothetical protein ACI4OJ_11770 [Lachnospiraceae bacterium]
MVIVIPSLSGIAVVQSWPGCRPASYRPVSIVSDEKRKMITKAGDFFFGENHLDEVTAEGHFRQRDAHSVNPRSRTEGG